MSLSSRRLGTGALLAVTVVAGAWWLGTPLDMPEDPALASPRSSGVRQEMYEATLAVGTLVITAIGSGVAIAAAWRPGGGLVPIFIGTVYLATAGNLALIRLGWWSVALHSNLADYRLAPWIALGYAWLVVAGAVIVLRRRKVAVRSWS